MNNIKNIVFIFTVFSLFTGTLIAQVWPGDINNNGEVNSIDLLYLGYAYGTQGAQRPNPSTNWLAQTAAPAWGTTFPTNQLDVSYADCDGDGIIDIFDVDVIEQNYHLTHNNVVPYVLLTGTAGIDPAVEVKRTTTDTLVPGNQEYFELHLGPNHVNNFYGISFTISFDTTYVDSVVNVFPAIGWITNNGQDNVIQVSNAYLEPNAVNGKNGRIDVAYSRTNGQKIFGTGIIGIFSIVMEEHVSGRYSGLPVDFEFEILNIRMVDPLLNLMPTVPSISEFYILTTNNSAPLIQEETNLIVYPNPASDYTTVYSENIEINQVEIIDINGRLVRTLQISNAHRFDIQLYDLQKGVYILKLSTQEGLLLKKLMITD